MAPQLGRKRSIKRPAGKKGAPKEAPSRRAKEWWPFGTGRVHLAPASWGRAGLGRPRVDSVRARTVFGAARVCHTHAPKWR